MNTRKIMVVLGIMAGFASTVARAGMEAQYEPLLKELNKAMCTIQDPNASNKAMAKAQHQMLAINNKLSPIKAKLSSNPAAYNKFLSAERKATTDCKAASVGAGDYKPLLKELRKNTCVLMGGGSPMEGAKAAAANDRIRKELRSVERSLELGDKKTYGAYKQERIQAESGAGC